MPCRLARNCRFLGPNFELSAVDRIIAERFLDTEELVILGDPVRPAHRASLDLPCIGSHRNMGDGGVLGLPRAVRDLSLIHI